MEARQLAPATAQSGDVVPIAPSAGDMLAMLVQAARDPNIDPEKLERLATLAERMQDRSARGDYAAALAEMQPELPVVHRNGRIEIKKKDTEIVIQSTPYALFEDINQAVREPMGKYGFALSFRTGTTPEGKVRVTAILSHKGGHAEETTLELMLDTTGSKNNVQAMGSSISYGKRITMCALLNITSRGEDDDGEAGGREGSAAFQKAVADINAWTALAQLQEWKKTQAEGVRKIVSDKEWKDIIALVNRRGEALKSHAPAGDFPGDAR